MDVVRTVAHDLPEPSAHAVPLWGMAQRGEPRILHEVLGGVFVPRQAQGEPLDPLAVGEQIVEGQSRCGSGTHGRRQPTHRRRGGGVQRIGDSRERPFHERLLGCSHSGFSVRGTQLADADEPGKLGVSRSTSREGLPAVLGGCPGRLKELDLGAFPDGPVPALVTVEVDGVDLRNVAVRMVKKGKALRY